MAEPRPPSRPLVAVVAMGRNGAIGLGNALPWSLPSDLARFRALTMGKPMIMGRRTFESIGRALPGRDSVVVSRGAQPDRSGERVYPARSIEAAVAIAEARASATGAAEIAVIGGAAIFAALLPRCERLHLTLVDLAPRADTFLEAPDLRVWREIARETPPRQERDDADCLFLTYERAGLPTGTVDCEPGARPI